MAFENFTTPNKVEFLWNVVKSRFNVDRLPGLRHKALLGYFVVVKRHLEITHTYIPA